MEKTVRIGGIRYSIYSDDRYLEGVGDVFEPSMVQLFRALVRPDDVVADIGANIGLTAILFSSLARQVIAFEPSPTTFEILLRNLTRSGVKNVEAVNLGLGSERGAKTITFSSGNRSGGYVSDRIRPESGHVTEEITIDTFEDYFNRVALKPSFLKVDVEGFEQNVIKGGGRLLEECRPTVVMEMNHFCLNVLQRVTLPDFLDFMRSVFPVLYAVDADNQSVVDLHDSDSAYLVMHEHVVRFRFPNLVGAFDESAKERLVGLTAAAGSEARRWIEVREREQAALARAEAAETREEVAVERAQAAEARENSLLKSTSWRVTAPLRGLSPLLRRIRSFL